MFIWSVPSSCAKLYFAIFLLYYTFVILYFLFIAVIHISYGAYCHDSHYWYYIMYVYVCTVVVVCTVVLVEYPVLLAINAHKKFL